MKILMKISILVEISIKLENWRKLTKIEILDETLTNNKTSNTSHIKLFFF